MDKLINEIEQQTNYLFVYGENDIDLQQKVKVDARNKPISEVLDKTLKNLGITYEFSKNYISLRRIDADKTGVAVLQQTRKVRQIWMVTIHWNFRLMQSCSFLISVI